MIFSDAFHSTFYSLKGEEVSTVLDIDFGTHNVPKNMTAHDLGMDINSEYSYRLEFFELKNSLIFSFLKDKKRQYGIYNFLDKQKVWGYVKNDISNVPFYPRFSNKENLIGIGYQYYNDSLDYDLTTCINLNEDIKANDNPVLLFFKLKK